MEKDISTDKPILEQYRNLTKYDKAAQGTLCRIIREDDKIELYVQVSPLAEEPEWIAVGHLLENVFASSLYDDKFILKCVKKFNRKVGGA